MADKRDYYEVLGVSRSASESEISRQSGMNFGYVTENGVNSNWKIANWEGVCYDRTDGERR